MLWLVTEGYEPSGVGEHMLSLAAAALRRWDVLFSCPPGSLGDPLLARAAALGCRTRAIDTAWTWPYLAEVPALLRRERIDLCHIHAGIGWEGLDLVPILRRGGVPTIVRTEHLPHVVVGEAAIAYARTARLVDRIVCVSRSVAESFRKAGIAEDRLTIVRNGVGPPRPRTDRATVRAALGIPTDVPVVLTVARFCEQKDHATLLASAQSVLARMPQARFLWVGSGPLEASLRQSVATRGLSRRVLVLGQRGDVPDLLAAADLFVLSSRFEGLPLSILEAMAAGLPVAATRVSGTDEAVRDGVTGFLVLPGNPASLAEAILDLLSRPERAAAMGAAGRERAETMFGVDAMMATTLAIYDEVSVVAREAAVRSDRARLDSAMATP